MVTKKQFKFVAETKLEKSVASTIADKEGNVEGNVADVLNCGCASGVINSLIYTVDTNKFFLRHQAEINTFLAESFKDFGYTSCTEMFGEKWDLDDPLALDPLNRNLLAWWAFEETTMKLAGRCDIEV